jgi:hypothetical protein
MFKNIQEIMDSGFVGFKTVFELWSDISVIPNEKGIYLIINPECSMKTFLSQGVGGYFKGKEPNVSLQQLDEKWINDCHILYIGKAGGNASTATLRKRLKQYMDFGKGKPVGHYGGRFIWQIANHKNLIVAWKTTPASDPREEEKKLIQEFAKYYGKIPFANLTT